MNSTEYRMIVYGFDETTGRKQRLVFSRGWNVTGGDQTANDAEALDALGQQMCQWARGMKQKQPA